MVSILQTSGLNSSDELDTKEKLRITLLPLDLKAIYEKHGRVNSLVSWIKDHLITSDGYKNKIILTTGVNVSGHSFIETAAIEAVQAAEYFSGKAIQPDLNESGLLAQDNAQKIMERIASMLEKENITCMVDVQPSMHDQKSFIMKQVKHYAPDILLLYEESGSFASSVEHHLMSSETSLEQNAKFPVLVHVPKLD